MTKQKKILITTISVFAGMLLLAVLLIVLKKRVFPALNDYSWSYEQEFVDEHDSDMVIDGKLDESVWTGQKWLTHSENGVTLKYTTVFTKYGVYVGAIADDDDLQWTKRFNFGMYNNNASNSAFHFRISHSDAEKETTFTTFNFYVDAKDSVSRNQTRHEAKSSLNGELNPKEGQTKATQMTSEMFISWEALHLKDGKPESIRIYPEYRYVEGEKSLNNKWIAPICYVRINTAMFSCALFDESGYINADETGALLGNSKTEMSKSDGWDISKADKGSVTSSDYYEQNIFYREVCSDAYVYSTTMKITGQQKGKTGYAGVCDIKDSQNATMFYVNAAGVLSDEETLTIYMRDYAAEKTTTIGTIPNKASYKTEGIPLTVIKDNKNVYYIVDGNLVHAKEVSLIEGKSSPGFFTSSAAVEYTNCKVTDYADNKDALKSILSKYAFLVKMEGSISGGSVTTDMIAIARNGKVAGEDLELSIMADNGYILTELTIEGTNQKSSDYLAYAVEKMIYGSLTIPKESITGDIVISAKFTSVMKAFDKNALVTVSGKVTNATGEKQSAKIVIHHKGSVNPILSSVTQSSVSGEFDIYLLKKGTYTIGNGVKIQSDGQFTFGASNNGYLTTYASADTNNSEKPIEIVLKKNRVSRGYSETGEGYYKSSSADAHNYFTGGITDEWDTNMTLPKMPEGQMVGYVLHEASSSVTWSQWIRIAAVAKEGKLNVFVYMNVDDAVFAQKYYNTGIDAAQAEGKVLQLMLKEGKLACYLDNKLVFLYVNNSMLNDYTVSEAIGLKDKVACGLYTNKAGVILTDYTFTREVLSEGEALYQVSGTVTADTDAMRRFQMIVTNTKTGEEYITDVDQYGKYSIALPVGQYRFILKHYSQDKFFYPTPVENNVIQVNQNVDHVAFTAKPVTTAIGTFNCKLNIPLIDAEPDEFKLRLKNDTYGEYNVYRNLDGSFITNAPVGTYRLSVKHKTESLYVENLFTVKIKEGQNNQTVTLKKNAITNGSFALTEELYYQSTAAYRHNRFTKSHGDAWETWLEMPALNVEEQVGVIIHRYKDNATVWGNWLRLMVGKNKDGKIEVVAQICADATRDKAEINVSTNRTTDIDADAVVGKKLQVVHKNGVLSLRLDGQIINLYTNETYLASRGKSTQVKNVLDLNGELTCGLLTNTKGIVIKDWAFTNVKKNVPNNPALNGTLRGKVELSIDTLKLDQVRILLKSKDGQMSFHTYAKADGTYEIKAPVGEYLLEVSNDGTAAYTHNTYEVIVRKTGTTQNVVLNSKNAINNSSFTLNKDGYYESTKAYGHNTFGYGYGKAWEASLEMPELNGEEQVGFILHRYKDNATVWGNWLRLLVGKNKDGKIELAAQICADATKDTAEINVSTSRPTDIDADDAVGKTLQAVYKDGVLSVRLDGQIINLYTNETYMASRGKSTQVKKVLDLNGELACGLLANTKGIVIKDWAFTNIEKNVPDNPVLNGTLKGKVELSINTLGLDQVRILLKSKDGKMSFHTYAKANGTYEVKAPVGEYLLEVSNDGVAAYTQNQEEVKVKKEATTKNIVLDSKNAINNSSFALTEDGYYESTKAHGHNTFGHGHGKGWEASLQMPELSKHELVGFIIHAYENNATVWGKWLRLGVVKTAEDKLQITAQICADATENSEAINVTSDIPTDLNADDYIGKTLKAVYKDGVLTLRLDGQILTAYVSDTYLMSSSNSTQVKNVLDLDGELTCGLLASAKGIVIQDWAFTNIEAKVSNNPQSVETLSGKVTTSVTGVKLEKLILTLRSKDGMMSFRTYAKADGTYEILAPTGEYVIEVTSDGTASYIPHKEAVTIATPGTEQDIVLDSKNKINNSAFTLTEKDSYKRAQGNNSHNYFVNGYGAAWLAEMTMPELNANETVGFVLHKRTDGKIVWGQWMRIGIQKTAEGTLQLFTQMHVDGSFDEAMELDMHTTSIEGKTFQVMLLDGKLVVSLDGKVLYKFASDTKFVSGNGTVGEVLGLSNTDEVYCGLYANKAGIEVKDWAFTNVSENLPNIPNYNASISGKVQLSMSSIGYEQVCFELSNTAGNSYVTNALLDGTYEIQAPAGEYQLKVTTDGATEPYIPYEKAITISEGENSQDVVLKNKMNKYFSLTSEGYYKCTQGDGQNYFVDGYGSVWLAEMTMSELNNGDMAGFVLHKRANGKAVWGNWMRVGIKKANNGTLGLYVKMNVDKNTNLQAEHTYSISETTVEGKTLQMLLLDGKLTVALDNKVLHTFTSDTKLDDAKGTVGEVLGLSNTDEVYCGLYANKAGIVIKDWEFTDLVDTGKSYTVSGTVSVGLQVADVTAAEITFVNQVDTSKTYTVKPDAEGKYSVEVPSGDYKVTVSYSSYYENNTFNCGVLFGDVTRDISLKKNTIYKNSTNNYFKFTEEGYYQTLKHEHTLFQSASGKQWIANMELPDLAKNQEIGFVLIKKDGGVKWGNWMRILIRKADNGTIKLFTQMHVDNSFDEATEIDVPTTSIEGKELQVQLVNGKIVISLDGIVLTEYTNSTALKANSTNTVETVFGKLGTNAEVYCGLYVTKDLVIKDWSFTNK